MDKSSTPQAQANTDRKVLAAKIKQFETFSRAAGIGPCIASPWFHAIETSFDDARLCLRQALDNEYADCIAIEPSATEEVAV